MQVYFPRGCKSLMRGVKSEALASRKVVTVRYTLKAARLQNPVLTNRNGI